LSAGLPAFGFRESVAIATPPASCASADGVILKEAHPRLSPDAPPPGAPTEESAGWAHGHVGHRGFAREARPFPKQTLRRRHGLELDRWCRAAPPCVETLRPTPRTVISRERRTSPADTPHPERDREIYCRYAGGWLRRSAPALSGLIATVCMARAAASGHAVAEIGFLGPATRVASRKCSAAGPRNDTSRCHPAGCVAAPDDSESHCSSGSDYVSVRWTRVALAWSVGLMMISSMFTCGGRVATHRMVSAMSAAVRGVMPW
jgi:hypothetical protein